jgi:hypothetical protein
VDFIPSPELVIPTIVEEEESFPEKMDVDPRLEGKNPTKEKNPKISWFWESQNRQMRNMMKEQN